MSTSYLVELPFELVLDIFERLDKKGLAPSKASHQLANQVLYKMSLNEIHRVLVGREKKHTLNSDEYIPSKQLIIAEKPGIGFEPLYCACKTGDMSLLHFLLDAGISPDLPVLASLHAFPPVAVAAMHNQTEVVRLLTAKGASLRSSSFVDNFSVLCRGLLDRGEVDANCEVEKRTALSAAAEAGKVDAIEFIIPRVSNYDNRALDGRMALRIAIRYGTEKSVRLLLLHTKSIDVTDAFMRTPLHDAIEHQSTAIASLLLDEIRLHPPKGALSALKDAAANVFALNSPSPSQMLSDALRTAVKLNKLEVVRLLLKHPDLIEPECDTSHLLHHAIRAGYLDIALALIEWGVDSEVKSPLEATALTLAVDNNHTDAVTLLIAAGASLDGPMHYPNAYGSLDRDNPFIYAVKADYVGFVRALMPFLDINEPTLDHSRTALQCAVSYERIKVIRALLESENIDLRHRDGSGMTALEIAREFRVDLSSDLRKRLSAL
ncbi:ankyrin repeat-containing domain protein [Aspergillus cavernicola]|uniref:Ankyrin repeat-containing domain protein n=1 Tax=Aspergillus cavernicola TaxID=176166 RepID=A0ABR4IUG6_9EURO